MAGELSWAATTTSKSSDEPQKTSKGLDVAELASRALLQSFAPASVLIDTKGNLLYVHGEIRNYLRPPPGQATLKIIDMAREGLQTDLRLALQASAQNHAVIPREVALTTEHGLQIVRLTVRSLPGLEVGQDFLLVSFTDISTFSTNKSPPGKRTKAGSAKTKDAERIEELERTLGYTRENLQATIEEQQASNEELKSTNEELQSTNEELQSTNEELQSTNEELETSREELQSVNEELITVNTELQSKIEQLAGMQNDMKNLLDNIHIATVFLDRNLAIRSFTREASQIYRLVATDVGRPLSNIKSDLSDDLTKQAQTVLNTLVPWQLELNSIDAWFLVRIQPYLTLENVIDGVVLTFTNISEQRKTSERIKRNEALLMTAQRIAGLGCWDLDVNTDSSTWSPELYNIFGLPLDSTPLTFKEFLNTLLHPDDENLVNAAMQAAIKQGESYEVAYRIRRPDGALRNIHARGEAVTNYDGQISHVVCTVQDITQN